MSYITNYISYIYVGNSIKFYWSQVGGIHIGDTDLKYIKTDTWRAGCAAIFQDSFIFNDSILSNIVMNDEGYDINRVIEIIKVVQLRELIDSLSRGYNTIIGSSGTKISEGQRQRILLARVIYKDAQFVFLDESMNSVDMKTEHSILSGFKNVFRNKTVVIVTHNPSSLKYVDNIIEMNNGKIVGFRKKKPEQKLDSE